MRRKNKGYVKKNIEYWSNYAKNRRKMFRESQKREHKAIFDMPDNDEALSVEYYTREQVLQIISFVLEALKIERYS